MENITNHNSGFAESGREARKAKATALRAGRGAALGTELRGESRGLGAADLGQSWARGDAAV